MVMYNHTTAMSTEFKNYVLDNFYIFEYNKAK